MLTNLYRSPTSKRKSASTRLLCLQFPALLSQMILKNESECTLMALSTALTKIPLQFKTTTASTKVLTYSDF